MMMASYLEFLSITLLLIKIHQSSLTLFTWNISYLLITVGKVISLQWWWKDNNQLYWDLILKCLEERFILVIVHLSWQRHLPDKIKTDLVNGRVTYKSKTFFISCVGAYCIQIATLCMQGLWLLNKVKVPSTKVNKSASLESNLFQGTQSQIF